MIFAVLIAVMTLCFFINLGYIKPSISDIAKGMFVPSIPNNSELAVINKLIILHYLLYINHKYFL